jgi:hypothetical protein
MSLGFKLTWVANSLLYRCEAPILIGGTVTSLAGIVGWAIVSLRRTDWGSASNFGQPAIMIKNYQDRNK